MQQVLLAGCVICDDRGRVLLLHRNTRERRQWEIPGGKLDPGEDARTTATRELREEMGVEVALDRYLGTRTFEEDGRTMVYTWFLARITAGIPRALESHIHDAVDFYDITDLESMVDELSPNARNLLTEITEGSITL